MYKLIIQNYKMCVFGNGKSPSFSKSSLVFNSCSETLTSSSKKKNVYCNHKFCAVFALMNYSVPSFFLQNNEVGKVMTQKCH